MRIHNVTAIVALSVAAPYLRAQAPTSSPKTDSAFARGEWSVALAGYLDLLKSDTTRAPVWFRLGISYHGLAKYKEAVSALSRARTLGAQPLAIELRLARAFARLPQRDSALAHLNAAMAQAPAGVANSLIKDEPDFATLRADQGFIAVLAGNDSLRYPCHAAPERQQFSFWIGQWDVAPWASPTAPRAAAGTNDVHQILENCVIYENWTGSGGGDGKSFNYFDSNIGKWRQIWVATGGGSLDYTGEFKDGAMRFAGWSLGPQGQRLMQKLTFTPFGKDTVRQTFEASADSGKTWTVTFDGRYVRRKGVIAHSSEVVWRLLKRVSLSAT